MKIAEQTFFTIHTGREDGQTFFAIHTGREDGMLGEMVLLCSYSTSAVACGRPHVHATASCCEGTASWREYTVVSFSSQHAHTGTEQDALMRRGWDSNPRVHSTMD